MMELCKTRRWFCSAARVGGGGGGGGGLLLVFLYAVFTQGSFRAYTGSDLKRDVLSEFMSCVKVEVAVLGSPVLMSLNISVSWFGLAVSGGTSVRIRFGSPFSSKVVVFGHCLVTLSLTIMKH